LLDFDSILCAPSYVPTNEPVSIFRTLGNSIDTEEEEEDEEQMFKNTLRNVLQKYTPDEPAEKVSEEEEPENEKDKQIPEIGRTNYGLTIRMF
jgi:hypothetical protein